MDAPKGTIRLCIRKIMMLNIISRICRSLAALGVALVRDSGALMVGQYFRRRRDAAEAALTASAGLGIAAVSWAADASMRCARAARLRESPFSRCARGAPRWLRVTRASYKPE